MKERKVMKSRNKNMKKQQNGIIPFLLLLSGILFFFVMLVFPLGEVIYRSLKEGMAVYGAAITAKNT